MQGPAPLVASPPRRYGVLTRGAGRAKEEPPMTLSAMERAASQSDDQIALFEQEALPYMRQLFPAALRLTRNRCDAEDLIQETFARAYQKFHLFSPGTNLRAWLHKIMYHSFYNGCRRRRSGPVETPVASIGDDSGTPPPWAGADSRPAEEVALEN